VAPLNGARVCNFSRQRETGALALTSAVTSARMSSPTRSSPMALS